MSVELVTYAGSNVTPQNDAIKDDANTMNNGIYYGCNVTIKDATTLHITAGQGIVYGRVFEIVDSDISVSLSSSGTILGQLYLHIDLANISAPAQLMVETGATLTPLIDDDQINITSGITEMQLATFNISTITLSDLVETFSTVRKLSEEIGTEDISGIGDGTIKGAIKTINSDLSNIRTIDTTEKIVGTFNGQTLYEKIVYNASDLNTNSIFIDVSSLQIARVISSEGYLANSTSELFAPLTTGYFNQYYNSTTKNYIIVTDAGFGNCTSALVKLKYIKAV